MLQERKIWKTLCSKCMFPAIFINSYATRSLPAQVCAFKGNALDTVYGIGDPNVHLHFSFDWATASTHQFGHYTLLIPTAGKFGKDSLMLDESASCSKLTKYIYIYIFLCYPVTLHDINQHLYIYIYIHMRFHNVIIYIYPFGHRTRGSSRNVIGEPKTSIYDAR